MRYAREGAQEEYYRQFSFRPAINERSRQLGQVQLGSFWHQEYCRQLLGPGTKLCTQNRFWKLTDP